MANQDTGLGWSANEDYLIQNGEQYIGELIESDYTPNINVLSSAPSIQDLMSAGASFSSNGRTYYVGIYCDRESYSGALEVAVYNGSTNRIISYVFLGDTQFHLNYLRISITDGTNIYTYSRNVSGSATWNPDIGLYQDDMANVYISWGDFGTLTPGTAKTGATLADVLAQFDPEEIFIYKMNLGYAVCCFAKWITIEGNTLVSPILISSVNTAAILSYDGIIPADPQTTFDFLHDGIPFHMALLPGYDSSVVTAQSSLVPVLDLTQFGASMPIKLFRLIASSSFANILVSTSPDPYESETDPSEEEGGSGDEDPEDDPVEEETLPIPAVSGLGFSTIYVPTAYDLHQLASYLWGGNLDLDNFLRLFANPMDSILGLSAVPVPLSGTYEPIYLGGQLLRGVTMPRYAGRTAVKVDMGSTTIAERWGSYLDYDPYTEFSVYLPFVGIKNIKADDIMGKTLSLMYNIDILSGACVAYIRTAGGSVLYEWAGQCAMQIPITGSNWDNIFSTAITAAVTLGGAMVAPASAPMLAGSVASAAVQTVAAKPRVERSGAVTGVTGFLGQLRPYIIRTIPEAYIPADQNKFIGYPAYINVSLSEIRGYNEVDSIHLENVPATGAELEEIESILKGGVIF